MKDHCLMGKTITDMKIANDKMALLFVTSDGDIIARVDGDCCSQTWIENVELPARGFPCKVMELEDIDLPDNDEDNYTGDVTQYYGFKLITDKGHIVIDYRNCSNGYYGGSIAWPDDYFYGGVYGQNVSECIWIDIR